MWVRTITTSIILFSGFSHNAQEVLYPLNANPVLMALEQEEKGLKAANIGMKMIPVDLDSSNYIIADDFSFKGPRPEEGIWADRNVYVNRNFPINPLTLGVVTFDGLDEWGYPYNFITSNAYGSCDTLTSQPIELGNVDIKVDDTVYLSFSYQPQGISPYANSPGDSFMLEFFQPNTFDTTITTDTNGVKDTTITPVPINQWIYIWSVDGYDLHATDTSCNYAMRTKTLAIDPIFYQDSFRLRFRSYGNTAGSVDFWHLDFVVLSSDSSAHSNVGDYAFRYETGSMIREYESMPWFHYVGHQSRYDRSERIKYKLRNTFSSNVEVDLEYRAHNAAGTQIDSVITIAVTPIPAVNCKQETMPVPGDALHTFVFPASAAPANSTTYFTTRNILKRRIGPIDLIQQNNDVHQYQVFGTYYAYDDGSAEAGYGVKSDKGKLAIRYVLAPGISDTLTGLYIYFNPVIIDRSDERFRLTVWDNNEGEPGAIIYESALTASPYYAKLGVNYFIRMELEQEIIVSDTFYVGYQMVTEEVLNIGYDMNRKNNDKIFYSTGGPWVNSAVSGSIPPGTVMIRPAFRRLSEPVYGIRDQSSEAESILRIFPNPASDYITMAMAVNDIREYRGQLVGADGRFISEIIFSGKTEIDVSSFPSGIYFVKIFSPGGGSAAGKFLVVH